jgi:hypothetical protein
MKDTNRDSAGVSCDVMPPSLTTTTTVGEIDLEIVQNGAEFGIV